MKNLITEVKDSLSKSDVYQKPEANTAKTALKYIAKLILVISAIKAITLGVLFVPMMREFKDFMLTAVDKFPADLVLTLSKEELSMNKPNPYKVPAPKEEGKSSTLENLIVIDTSKTLDIPAFLSYKTAILVTKDGFISMDNKNGGMKAQTFRKFPDVTISKETIAPYVGKISTFFGSLSGLWIALLTVLVWVGVSVVMYVGTMLASLLGSLVVFIVTKIKGHKLPFTALYGLSVRAYTSCLLLGLLATFGIGLPGWVSFVVFILIISLFVSKKEGEATAAVMPEVK